MTTVPNPRARRLTPEEREQIIELRLRCVPIRKVAEKVGCTPNTVTKVYRKHIEARSKERHAALELSLEEAVTRLERTANDARRSFQNATVAGDENAPRWLEVERKTLTELVRLHTTLIGNRTVVGAAAAADKFAQTLQSFVANTPTPPTVLVEYRDAA